MRTWSGGSELLCTLPMVVIERPGVQLQEQPADYELLVVEPVDVSSSLVRSRLDQGLSVRGLVPEAVLPLLAR